MAVLAYAYVIEFAKLTCARGIASLRRPPHPVVRANSRAHVGPLPTGARDRVAGALQSIFIVLFFLFASGQAAEISFGRGLEQIRDELCIARSGLRALDIAAHPDDEDGGTLSYLRRTLGVETHLCQVTRGEGGQNESGPELGRQLAVVRTRETEAACKILGNKAWYLNLPDFGFSKSPDEALQIWKHDYALGQMVRVIRIVRPHIVFSNHDPAGTDHGHHVASARLMMEAFDAAADPQKFTEQMKSDGTAPWSVSKLYVRHFAPPGATLSFDISGRDPISGLSATDIAAFALSKHTSQGMLRSTKLGEKDMRYFVLAKTRLPATAGTEKTMLDGLPESNTPALNAAIGKALEKLNAANLSDGSLARGIISAGALAASDKSISPEVRTHISNALAETLGLYLDASSSERLCTLDEPVAVTLRVANEGTLPVTVTRWALVPETSQWTAGSADPASILPPGESAEFQQEIKAQPGAYPTYPADDYLLERIEVRSPVRATMTLLARDPQTNEEAPVTLSQPVPVDLALPLRAAIVPDPVLVFDDPDHGDQFLILSKFRMTVANYRKLKEPLQLFGGIQATEDIPVDKVAPFTFQRADETLSEEFRVMAPVEKLNKSDLNVKTSVWSAAVNFGGPVAHIRRVPIKLPPTLNVGLVKTYDEATFQALKMMETLPGLTVTVLTPDDLRSSDLNRLHTIVLDIRATQYRPELKSVKERLMQFMKDGGNVVCMYQKDLDWNREENGQAVRGRGFLKGEGGGGDIAPYPIELSFDRVTDETAPVRFLKAGHPLLLEPCKIWEKDFQGWVQERGVYFPKKWAPEYTALLSSNDPGGAPLDGGLLVADVGRGSFIYTSYVLYRQLRAGVPGAYRLLANLISYPRVKNAGRKE